MDIFLDVFKAVKDYDILSLISIFLSPIISFLILIFTLRHDKKQFEIQLENQQYEHHETMALMEEQHKQVLLKQSEVNKISINSLMLLLLATNE